MLARRALRRLALALAVTSSLVATGAGVAAAGPAAGAGPARVAAAGTTSCQAVGGGLVSSPGPHHATFVVDTGSGPVWSACISFSGTITGIDAVELAKAQIPGLDPVYDVYTGVGRAVCQLRGVGNPPPDCLGKSASYWAYFHDGTYSRSGAGATQVADGDTDAWRWGTSSVAPRAATDGYRSVTTAPPPTTTTTRPSSSGGGHTTSTTRPAGISAGTTPGIDASAGATPGGASATTAPGASSTTTTPGASTTAVAGAIATTPAGAEAKAGTGHHTNGGSSAAKAGGGDEALPATTPTIRTVSSRTKGSGSGTRSAIAFVAVLAVAVGLGALLRRRRARGVVAP